MEAEEEGRIDLLSAVQHYQEERKLSQLSVHYQEERKTYKHKRSGQDHWIIVSTFRAIKYGPRHRQLENNKKVALAASRGHNDSDMCLSIPAKDELRWWVEVIQDAPI